MRQRVYFIGFNRNLVSEQAINNYKFPLLEQTPPQLSDYLIDTNNELNNEEIERFNRYLNNPTNQGKYQIEDFLTEDYLIIDTRMSDLRLYRGKVPTLRSQRDGIFYVKDGQLKNLTGYEALLLQGFPKEYANRVKNEVTNRHLLLQSGNAMTVNVIKALGDSIIECLNSYET
jgi:DNA (cytosine-5)-methyltransferase 1